MFVTLSTLPFFEAISIDVVFQIHYAQETGPSCCSILTIHAINKITDESVRRERDVKEGKVLLRSTHPVKKM